MGGAASGLAGVPLLAACGQQKSTGKPAADAAKATGSPKRGGTLNLPVIADFFDYDTSLNGKSQPNPHATSLAYNSLLDYKHGPDVPYGQNTVAPGLAERWESPDAMTFTFHLRPGLKFANLPPVNGRELTSADVKWTYEYYSRSGDFAGQKMPGGAFSYMFEGLDRIETPDATTIVVRFKQPFAPFLQYAWVDALPIVAHEIYDKDGDFKQQLVGSGPFQLDAASTQRGARWVFKRNPNYWQQGQPYVDTIQYIVLPDDASQYAAFQTQQIDILDAIVDLTAVAIIQKNNLKAIVQKAPRPGAQGMYVTYTHPPFNDPRMRMALSLAQDRDAFDRTFAAGQGGWVLPEALPDLWTQQEIKELIKYDPAQAKQMIGQAGYPDGVQVEFMQREGNVATNVVELLQSQLKKVGIDLTIKPADKATGSRKLHSGDFGMESSEWAVYGDMDSRYYGQYYSTSPSNWIKVKDATLDPLILAQRQEPDVERRRQRERDLTKYMAENAVAFALYRPVTYTFSQPYVKNYRAHWLQDDWDAANLWLAK